MSIDETLLQIACNPARANKQSLVKARLKQTPEDFIVDEIPVADPEGSGEHAWLHIRKRNTNTDWLAGQIARFADVDRRHVSYAGRKDRNALTTQWFSVHLPGKPDPDWTHLNNDEVEVLQAARHTKKLKRGALKGNHFTLRLHELDGDLESLDECLKTIKANGVPNYFGEQRFGHNGDNIASAARFLFERKKVNRNQKNILLSAARSLLFNAVLNERVKQNTWNTPIPGDVIQKDGRRGYFTLESVDDEILQRLASGEVHITGPMWGRGKPLATAEAVELEQQVLAPLTDWCEALERKGLERDIRPLRMNASELDWTIDNNTLQISFSLVAGCYATSVLRECLDWQAESEAF